jgi:hypothetical protein
LTAQGSNFFTYFDGILPPQIKPPTEAELPAVRDYLSSASPLVTSVPRAASFEPATFGTGTDAFGVKRVCGGYYDKGTHE